MAGPLDMTGRVVIVTGGTRGVGRGIAKRFLDAGADVLVCGRNAVDELPASGSRRALFARADVREVEQIESVIGLALERFARIDVLVNSAGHGPRAPVLELTDEDWHRGMDVYFLNVVRPTRLVTPIMQRQQSGAIVNISSFAAVEPDPVFPTSAVFRAGLAAFTKLYADQHAADGIQARRRD